MEVILTVTSFVDPFVFPTPISHYYEVVLTPDSLVRTDMHYRFSNVTSIESPNKRHIWFN